jgi:glycosyltransferase involved in cell wall biosynthesis
MLFSICINNYNYERYLGECIDSALNQSWPNVQVVVVDDGSNDSSREIIKSYGGRVKSVFKQNGGQGSAINEGFAASDGDWIIFLDADDVLCEDAVASIMAIETSAKSCIQYYLEVIDENSRETGSRLPTRPLHEGDVREVLAKFRCYTSPPSSGNAYSRRFLSMVLPMPSESWRIAADTYLIFSAPFHGNLGSVDRSLGKYRRHGGGASDSSSVDLLSLRKFISKELAKEYDREVYVRELLSKYNYTGRVYDYLAPTYLKYRLVESRVNNYSGGWRQIETNIVDMLNCAFRWPSYRIKHRVFLLAWSLMVMVLPLSILVSFIQKTMLPHWRARSGLIKVW